MKTCRRQGVKGLDTENQVVPITRANRNYCNKASPPSRPLVARALHQQPGGGGGATRILLARTRKRSSAQIDKLTPRLDKRSAPHPDPLHPSLLQPLRLQTTPWARSASAQCLCRSIETGGRSRLMLALPLPHVCLASPCRQHKTTEHETSGAPQHP